MDSKGNGNRSNDISEKPVGIGKPISDIGFFAEHAMVIEKARVAAQVGLTHLELQNRVSHDREELLRRTKHLEDFTDKKLEDYVLAHETAHWWRRISGTPLQIMGKVIGEIEAFGKFYPVGDLWIPPEVTREPVIDNEGNRWVWVEGIERFTTPSKLLKFAGFLPGMKRQKGRKNESNKHFRTVLFRLMLFGFKMNKNRYYDFYASYKLWKTKKLEAEGVKIFPTPKGRFCSVCGEEKVVPKDTHFCPECDTELSKKDEPKGVIWLGHLDAMCTRRALTLYLCHHWVIWRQAKGLPVRVPYAIEHMSGEHSTIIDPWEMCDLPEAPPAPVRDLSDDPSPAKKKRAAKIETELL